MDVKDRVQDSEGHSIEWGAATWNPNDLSIRNRYDNVDSGKFNRSGSGEIPWKDFNLMINHSISRGKFSKEELAEILVSIAANLKEQE